MEKKIIKHLADLELLNNIGENDEIFIDLEKNDDVISLKGIKNKVIVNNGTVFVTDMDIEIHNKSVCYAKSHSLITAYDNSTVYADNMCKVYLFNNAYCEATDNVRLELRNDSKAKISGKAKAILFNNSSADAIEDSNVECNDNSFAKLKDNADGVIRGYAKAEFANKSKGYVIENGEGFGYDNAFLEASNNARIVLNDYSTGRIYENSVCIVKGYGNCESKDKSKVMQYTSFIEKANTLEKMNDRFDKYNEDTYIGYIKSRKVYRINDIVKKEKEVKGNLRFLDKREHIYKVLINLENINLYNENTLVKATDCKIIDVVHKIAI